MKKIIFVLVFIAALGATTLSTPEPAHAQIPALLSQVVSTIFGARPTLVPQPTEQRPQVVYGLDVTIDQPVQGDLIVAGGRVVINQAIGGDLLVAGGLVQLNAPVAGDTIGVGGMLNLVGNVNNDLRIAGIGVNLDNVTAKNAMIAAGFLRQAQRSAINGSLMAAAYRAWLDGVIGGNLDLNGSQLVLNSAVGGTVNVTADTLSIGKTTQVIEGLNAQLTNVPTIDPNAKIQGTLNVTVAQPASASATPTTVPAKPKTESGLPFVSIAHAQTDGIAPQTDGIATKAEAQLLAQKAIEKQNALVAAKFRWFLVSVAATIVGGSLLLWLFPAFQKGQAVVIRRRAVVTGTTGLLWLFMGLIASLLFMLTVIGLPIGVVILLLWIANLLIAPWAVSQALGSLMLSRWQATSPIARSAYLQLALGAVMVTLLMMLPYVGWVVRSIVWIFGMGAPLYWLLNRNQPELMEAATEWEPAPKPVRTGVEPAAATTTAANATPPTTPTPASSGEPPKKQRGRKKKGQ